MITAEYLSLEFEHPLPKLDEITSNSLVLLAGDALAPTDIIRDVRAEAEKEEIADMRSIARLIGEVLADHRKDLITENLLRPRGFGSFEEYYAKASSLPPTLVDTLDTEIARFEDVHEIGDMAILLAGVDETGPHIYLIESPGTSTCFDAIGYHATGIGEQHAISSISSYGYVDNFHLNDAVFLSYEAKRKAERAPGVGRETDIRVIDSKGIHEVSAGTVSMLAKAYQDKSDSDSKWLKDLPNFGLL
jgi:hypothetical protein